VSTPLASLGSSTPIEASTDPLYSGEAVVCVGGFNIWGIKLSKTVKEFSLLEAVLPTVSLYDIIHLYNCPYLSISAVKVNDWVWVIFTKSNVNQSSDV